MVFNFFYHKHSPKMYIGKGQKQQNQVQLYKISSTKEKSVYIYQKCITRTHTKAEEKGGWFRQQQHNHKPWTELKAAQTGQYSYKKIFSKEHTEWGLQETFTADTQTTMDPNPTMICSNIITDCKATETETETQ